MTQRTWWIGVALVVLALLVHASVTRYMWQHEIGVAWVRADCPPVAAPVVSPSQIRAVDVLELRLPATTAADEHPMCRAEWHWLSPADSQKSELRLAPGPDMKIDPRDVATWPAGQLGNGSWVCYSMDAPGERAAR